MPALISVVVAQADPERRQQIAGLFAQSQHVWCVVHVAERADLLRWTLVLRPDLVISDPDLLPGLRATAWLRQRTPQTRIVAVVASDSGADQARARERGADMVVEERWFHELSATSAHCGPLALEDATARLPMAAVAC